LENRLFGLTSAIALISIINNVATAEIAKKQLILIISKSRF
jgi:hypothetical protein